jgi:hypothetical protein
MLRHEVCQNRITRHNENINCQIEILKTAKTILQAEEAFYNIIKLNARIQGIQEAMGEG